jgi:ribosomal protein L11 methylase PrmA
MADPAPVSTPPAKDVGGKGPASKTSAKSPPKTSPVTGTTRDTAQDLAAAHEAQTTIEADPALEGAGADDDDDDEAYGSETSSRASTSVSSSVRDYAFENNRRYHKFHEGRYHFPNDEPEQEREDMKHAMIVNLCNGRLHYAPLENPQMILDLGTGTGIWAIDSMVFLILTFL